MKVVDPLTLIFKTATPHVLLPSDLASVMIVSKAHGEKAATEDYNSGKAAIGTGPYKFAEYIPNQRVVLKANYGYWGGEEPWDKVTFKILTNPAARVAALLSSDVQMIETVPTSDIRSLGPKEIRARGQGLQPRDLRAPQQWSDKAAPVVTAKDASPSTRTRSRRARAQGAVDGDQPRGHRRPRDGEGGARGTAAAGFFTARARSSSPSSTTRGRQEAARRGRLPERVRAHRDGPNNRYINDDKVAQAIAQFLRAPASTPRSRHASSVYFTRATKGEFGYICSAGHESGEQGSSRARCSHLRSQKGMA